MQRQYLLAIVLSFLVIYGWQALFPPPRKAPAQPQAGGAPTASQTPAPQETLTPAPSAAAVEATSSPLVAATSEQDVVVENPSVIAVFTTRGAVLKSWRLKHYHDGAGAPLELIPEGVPSAPKPFTLEVDDAATSALLRTALFKPDTESLNVGSESRTLTFEYRDAAGLVARKQFTFTPQHPYLIRFAANVSRNATALNPAISWGPALGTGIVAGGMNYARTRFDATIVHRRAVVERPG